MGLHYHNLKKHLKNFKLKVEEFGKSGPEWEKVEKPK